MAETLIGLKELQKKLIKLDASVEAKVLKAAVFNATTPAFKSIKAAAPVGSKAHKTYKGNLVAPGFLRRSVKRVSQMRSGKYKTWASTAIGVRAESFYGVLFIELGTKKMQARPWMVRAFESQRRQMEQRLAQQLRSKIMRAAR